MCSSNRIFPLFFFLNIYFFILLSCEMVPPSLNTFINKSCILPKCVHNLYEDLCTVVLPISTELCISGIENDDGTHAIDRA